MYCLYSTVHILIFTLEVSSMMIWYTVFNSCDFHFKNSELCKNTSLFLTIKIGWTTLFQKTGHFLKPTIFELVFQGKIHKIEHSVEHDMAPPAHEKKNFWLDASNSIWIHGSKCGLDFTFVTQVGCRVLVNTKTKKILPSLTTDIYCYITVLCLVNFVVISNEVRS